jgi:hypothetical protein
MLIVQNKILVNILTLNFANAITLFPFIFIKYKSHKENKILINHERIHIQQQLELLIIPFYIIYLLDFLIKFMKFKSKKEAYLNISFEKEAYSNQNNFEYIKIRKFWAFLNYV